MCVVYSSFGQAPTYLDTLNQVFLNTSVSADSLAALFRLKHKSIPDSIKIEALNMLKRKEAEMSASSLINITKIRLSLMPNSKVESIWEDVIEQLESRQNSDTVSLAYALNSLGEFYAKQGNKPKSIDLFLQVIKLFPSNSLEQELGFSNNNLGILFQRQNDPAAAVPFFNRAQQIFSHHLGKDNLYIAVILSNIGMAEGELGRMDKKLASLLASYDIRIKHVDECDKFMHDIHSNLAQTYRQMKDYDQAEYHLNEVLRCAKIHFEKQPERLIHAYNEMASLQASSKKYDDAFLFNYYESAIQHCETLPQAYHSKIRNLYNNYAVRLNHNKKFTKSIVFAQKAIQTKYKLEHQLTHVNIPYTSVVRDFSLKDLTMLTNMGNSLYYEYVSTGDMTYLMDAKELFRVSDSLVQELKPKILRKDSRQRIKSGTYRHYVFHSLVNLALYKQTSDQEYIDEQFKLIEKSKSWDLLEQFSFSDRALQLKDSKLTKEIHQLKTKIGIEHQKNDSLSKVLSIRMKTLQQEHPQYYEQLYNNEVINVAQLQERCARLNENWLSFFKFSKTSSGTIFISKDTVLLIANTSMVDDIQLHKSALLEAIHTKKWSFVEPARKLYEILLDPIDDHIRSNHIVISGTTNYLNIPFAVLLTNSYPVNNNDTPHQDIPFLIKEHDISYMHSATLGEQTSMLNGDMQSAMFFAPIYSNASQALKYNIIESTNGSEYLDGNLRVGQEVSEEALLQSLSEQDLIHYAGHVVSSSTADSIYLLLSDAQDSLFLYEIMKAKATAKLVVLSGCESGLGQQQYEAFIGASYGFAFAGCPNSLSTLWMTEDESSSTILSDFYNEISQGIPSIKSINTAQRLFVKKAPQPSKHPFYWAPMVYYGNNTRFIGSKKFAKKKFFLFSGIGLGLLILFGYWIITKSKYRTNKV